MKIPDHESAFCVVTNAKKYGMEVNSDQHHANRILDKLEANDIKYGAPYCPCLNNHNEDTICPCKHMREQQACRCGLYVRRTWNVNRN